MNLRIILSGENISKNAKLPSKQEYINRINTCIQFSELVKQELNDSFQNQFNLLHSTSLRFWDKCQD